MAAAIVVAVVAAAGLGAFLFVSENVSASSTTQSYSGPPPVRVSIYDGASNVSDPPGYAPDNITVVIGVNNTVTWENDDPAAHTVTSTAAPPGESFNSGNMAPGTEFTHTFAEAGTYQYHCQYHGWMTGMVVVKAS